MRTETVLLLTAGALVLAGCVTTSPTGNASPSGFLANYEQLTEGEGDQPQLFYQDESVDYARYDRVILEPLTLFVTEGTALSELEEEEAGALKMYFEEALRTELAKEFALVEEPGENTLRVRFAMTEARGANALFNAVSGVSPIGLTVSTAAKVSTGTHAFASQAAVEFEVLDAGTGERLLAGVDERGGSKNPLGGTWGDVKKNFDLWAERLREHLTASGES